MDIPLLDLKRQYQSIKHEIEPAVSRVMESAKYIMGSEVNLFEGEIASYLGCRYAMSCANGTDALVLALEALGIGSGDEVITTPFTFFATAEAISRVGATPVFADVLPDSYNIDPDKIEAIITNKTKAIMPVHIFGQVAQMEEILYIADKYGLYVIEDACQAMGAAYKGRKAGTIGDVGCFSFFPTKNLGCFGDGGLVVTDDERTMKILRALKAHGGGEAGREAYDILNHASCTTSDTDNISGGFSKYFNYLIGHNSRLDEIQAAILRVKLKHLDPWNAKRRQLAARYNEMLQDTSLVLPANIPESESIYHLYVVQVENREHFISKLKSYGISTGVYYPVPLHLQKVFTSLGYSRGDLPVSEYLSQRTVALPIFPELTEEEQDHIISCIIDVNA